MSKPTRYDRDALAITWYVIGAVLACIAIAALTSGCSTVRSAVDEYRDWRDEQKAKKEQPATPTTPPAQPETPDTPTKPETPAEPSVPQGDNTFLWKPVSDSRQGRACAIIPAKLGKLSVRINGSGAHVAEVTGPANGNRWHYFLRQTGSAYGRNVSVEALDASGAVRRKWVVPDGSARWGSN